MRIPNLITAAALSVLPLLALGCGSRSEAPAPDTAAPEDGRREATEEDLYRMWDEMAGMPLEEIDLETARAVATHLIQKDPANAVPLLERVAEPDAAIGDRFLALVPLRPLLQPEHEAVLAKLASPENDVLARGVAVELLTALGTESGAERVRALMDDEDVELATSAMLARLHQSDPAAVARIQEFWDKEGVPDKHRQEIVRRIPGEDKVVVEHMDIFIHALSELSWDQHVRERAISAVGGAAHPRAIEAMRKAALEMPEPQLKVLASKAVDAMEARAAQPISGVAVAE